MVHLNGVYPFETSQKVQPDFFSSSSGYSEFQHLPSECLFAPYTHRKSSLFRHIIHFSDAMALQKGTQSCNWNAAIRKKPSADVATLDVSETQYWHYSDVTTNTTTFPTIHKHGVQRLKRDVMTTISN